MKSLINWYNINKYKLSNPIFRKTKEWNKILELTSFLDIYYNNITPKQRIWHLENNIFDIQYCKICQKELTVFDKHYGYQEACSKKCRSEYIKSVQEKSKKTCLERYGVERYQQTKEYRQKVKKTCLERYGVKSASCLKSVQEKSKKTCLERYGVKSASCLKSVQAKIHETKKLRGSYEKSNSEDKVYEFLLQNFESYDIIRQYRDERYFSRDTGSLFRCDFYIKSLDLFIEYDGYWTHILHLPKKKRFEIVRDWLKKSENSVHYERALKAYRHDCLKREISKKNNLNIQFVRNIKDIKIYN